MNVATELASVVLEGFSIDRFMFSISVVSIDDIRFISDYDRNVVTISNDIELSELKERLGFVEVIYAQFKNLGLVEMGTRLTGVDYAIANRPEFKINNRVNTCINIEMFNGNLVNCGGVQVVRDALRMVEGASVYLTMYKQYVEGGVEMIITNTSVTLASFSPETSADFKAMLDENLT
jgi:hypothetical protein